MIGSAIFSHSALYMFGESKKLLTLNFILLLHILDVIFELIRFTEASCYGRAEWPKATMASP